MPHQCTNCTRVFDDGSKEMLSGCPNCGGNKFQFSPSKGGRDDAAETTGRRVAVRRAGALHEQRVHLVDVA